VLDAESPHKASSGTDVDAAVACVGSHVVAWASRIAEVVGLGEVPASGSLVWRLGFAFGRPQAESWD
jgi:hypothetical protein